MRRFYTSKNCLAALRTITLAAAAALAGLACYFIPMRKAAFITSAVVAAVAVAASFIYYPLYLSSVKYSVSAGEIVKTSGVFIKFNQSIKFASIQYSTIIRTPFSDKTGLNMVVFFVFGGQMRLPFLSVNDARELLLLSGCSVGEEL